MVLPGNFVSIVCWIPLNNCSVIEIWKKCKLSMGHLVVEKVVDSWYQYDTNTDLANLNIGICYPMQSVTKSKVSIELLDIDWHKICIRWQKGSQYKLMITRWNRCLPDSSQGIQCCQPSKICKIDKNIWKTQKDGLAILLLPMNYTIPRYYRVTLLASMWYPIYCRSLTAKSALVTWWHRQPTEKSESSCIAIRFVQSLSVPGLMQIQLK
jgi:hypothetical protein